MRWSIASLQDTDTRGFRTELLICRIICIMSNAPYR